MINEQLQLLLENEGLIPSEIAERTGISVASVIDSLRSQVGEGALRLSDIYFGWRAEKRQLLHGLADDAKKTGTVNSERLRLSGVTAEDLEFLRSIHKRQTFASDLYDHIAEAEIALHSLVKKTLVEKFGDEEDGYWREGIPLPIRQRCHARREEDDEPVKDPFKYTTLIELSQIIASNWSLFLRLLPAEYRKDKPTLINDLQRLNGIRNAVMHPVKRKVWSEDDFAHARKLRQVFQQYRHYDGTAWA